MTLSSVNGDFRKSMGEWQEDRHPRAHDGKFSSGADENNGPAAPHPGVGGVLATRATLANDAHEALRHPGFLEQHREALRAAEHRGDFEHKVSSRTTTEEHDAQRRADYVYRAKHEAATQILREQIEDHEARGRGFRDRHHELESAVAGPHEERLLATVESGAGTHDARMAAITEAKADIANEEAVRAAGHMPEMPHVAYDQHAAAVHEARSSVDEMHQAQHEALTAVHELNALHSEDDAIGLGRDHDRLDGENLHGAYSDTAEHAHGHRDAPDYEGEHENLGAIEHDYEGPIEFDRAGKLQPHASDYEHVPFEHAPYEHDPDLSDEENAHAKAEHDQDQADAKAEHDSEQADAKAADDRQAAEHAAYSNARDERLAAFSAKAHEAQTKLEAAHEKQLAVLAHAKTVESRQAKMGREIENEIGRHSEGEVDIPGLARPHENAPDSEWEAYHAHPAHRAYDTALAYRQRQIEDGDGPFSDEAHDTLKEAARQTAAAIKQLARHTGREPKLPSKAPKPGKTRKSRPAGSTDRTLQGMAANRYKLTLTKLDFVSLVDQPAQQTATVRLIKRAGSEQHDVTMLGRIEKVGAGDSPLVYCWAFTCTDESGAPYHDLQGDAVSPDFIAAAEEFVKQGGAVDEMHDGKQTSRIAFAYPMDADIAAAMLGKAAGAATKVAGLMVAIRPTPEALAKIRSGHYTGVSIAGTGLREVIKARTAKAMWSTADVDGLPDSSFLFIEPGGTKEDGKTTPRNLRHFPYRDAAGKIDLPHLRNAVSRIPQSSLPKAKRDALQVKAERLLGEQHAAAASAEKRVAKQSVLTSETKGHAHGIDLEDPVGGWTSQLTTTYATSTGAANGHCHAWTFDAATGVITIAADSGHDHTIDAVVPADVLARAAAEDETCDRCGATCEEHDRYCANCGACVAEDDDADSGSESDGAAPNGPTVVLVQAGAPGSRAVRRTKPRGRFSSPYKSASTVNSNSSNSQENHPMDPKIAKMIAAALLLPEAQRAHVAKLATEDLPSLSAFMALDSAGREAATAAALAADPVMYTTRSGGQIRKSHGELAKQQAEQIDKQAAQIEAQNEALTISKAQREQAELEKRAAEIIPLIGKSAQVRIAILKAANAVTDEALRNDIVEALKGANYAAQMLAKATGVGGDAAGQPTGSDAKSIFNAELAAFAKSVNKSVGAATGDFLRTERGAELYGDAYPRNQA